MNYKFYLYIPYIADDVASGAVSHTIDMSTFDDDYNLTEETVETQN